MIEMEEKKNSNGRTKNRYKKLSKVLIQYEQF